MVNSMRSFRTRLTQKSSFDLFQDFFIAVDLYLWITVFYSLRDMNKAGNFAADINQRTL